MRISLLLSFTLLSAATVWAQTTAPPPLDFEGAEWIWTGETIAGKPAAWAVRRFRKAFTAPKGKIPVFVHTVSTADDGHYLYVNGALIAQADSIVRPQAACARLNPGTNVFALVGSNTAGATAGVLAKFRITYSDGTTSTVVTDGSWKVGTTSRVYNDFESLAFNDKIMGIATSLGKYGVGPWKKPHPAQKVPQCPELKPVESETPQKEVAQEPLEMGSCPVGCVPFDSAIDEARQALKNEERRVLEAARQEWEEAQKAREEAHEFLEKQRAAMEQCGCATEPSASSAPTIASSCSEPFILTWSSPTSRCGCVSTFNQAQRRDPNAVQCLPPANHGQVACENTGPASSRCKIICDDGLQLTPDQTDCIATTRDETISEFDCSADAEHPGFLTAHPDFGCICADAKTESFCGVSAGHPDAEMMCIDTTDSWGHSESKCQVQCPEGFTATDKKTCEMVKDKDETANFERPCIQDAPDKADANMQALIEHTMEKLNIPRCQNGYEFIKTATGYQCTGGAHRVTFEELGMN
ncbi:Alpha-L-rhamnosidase-like protein [Mycena sanguinolenta]|uniref:Alpha-L-rhamnosidase-like protein n=1 Tax=Mycena sanguinolenta TaxID=230812 RepID=A0A8H6ZF49_9AGAR|nr:Alpha-L-rhamnosidase-like protein [Mycena sanguinolenta]